MSHGRRRPRGARRRGKLRRQRSLPAQEKLLVGAVTVCSLERCRGQELRGGLDASRGGLLVAAPGAVAPGVARVPPSRASSSLGGREGGSERRGVGEERGRETERAARGARGGRRCSCFGSNDSGSDGLFVVVAAARRGAGQRRQRRRRSSGNCSGGGGGGRVRDLFSRGSGGGDGGGGRGLDSDAARC